MLSSSLNQRGGRTGLSPTVRRCHFRISDFYNPSLAASAQNKKWFLTSWARAGDRILTDFVELPSLASYWSDPAELIFNPTLPVQLNVDHIIRDNLNRFPVELGGHLDINGVPTDLAASPEIETEAGCTCERVGSRTWLLPLSDMVPSHSLLGRVNSQAEPENDGGGPGREIRRD